ncbi:hypothetical protein LTR85_008901 [Meristemomyces frigidus]|nr:hypothetical protein LTR85_008901 [Meristemomyces frigidus]
MTSACTTTASNRRLSLSDLKKLYWRWGPVHQIWSNIHSPCLHLAPRFTLDWSSGPWNPHWLGPGGMKFVDYNFEWTGDGRELYLATLGLPDHAINYRAGVFSGIWSADVAMFVFRSACPEALLVAGTGWTERWWITLKDLVDGFALVPVLYHGAGKTDDRNGGMVCLPYNHAGEPELKRIVPPAIMKSNRPRPIGKGIAINLEEMFEQREEPLCE